MSKLLRAGVRRYIRNVVFWLAVVATGVVAVIASSNARSFYFDDIYCIIVFLSFAVMISWLVGRENDEGIFKNKIIAGYTKGQIFISELILGVGACLLLFLLFASVFSIFNGYVFTKASLVVCSKIFLDALLVNMCFAVILVTLGCLISRRAIVAIVNIILVLIIIFISYGVQHIAEQEEYFIEYEYEDTVVTDELGTHVLSVPIEGTEHEVKNQNYIDGPIRVISEVIYDIMPYGHITEYIHLTSDWYGYDYYKDAPETDMTWETSGRDLSFDKEDSERLNYNLIWSVIVNTMVCAVGYICFSKKELR